MLSSHHTEVVKATALGIRQEMSGEMDGNIWQQSNHEHPVQKHKLATSCTVK